MEDSDTTTALKKAYAEIILNTAKESAARVIFSDRKAARFHHDLSETKEEALRLLVRLKHMVDAKTIEADVVSSNKQREIDVLEAQLHEAEDIITELRSEVRWVRERLEKAMAFESHKVVNKEEEERVCVHKVVVECLNPDQEDRSSLHDVECDNDEKQFDGLSVDVCESELDGDIRIKKLELSRNGCTQRIHALERRSSSSADEEELQGTPEKDSEVSLSSVKVNGHEADTLGNTRCLVLALRASSAEVVTMPLGIKKTSKSRKLRGRRKRRFSKPKATPVRSQSQLLKPCQSQSNALDGEDSMETHLSVESKEVDALKTCKEVKELLQLKRSIYSGDICKGKKRKTMHQTDHLVEACQESDLVSIKFEDADNKTKTKSLPGLNPWLTSVNNNVDLTSGSINVTVVSAKATDKDLTSRKEDVLVSCEGEEVTAVVSDGISESPRDNVNRLIKYTFQRKRKRGSSNINDNSNNVPRKHEENKAQDPTESTLST